VCLCKKLTFERLGKVTLCKEIIDIDTHNKEKVLIPIGRKDHFKILTSFRKVVLN